MKTREVPGTNKEGVIPLAPILQTPFAKSRQDDWSGVSNPVVRRKLQNRLNQRASRRRRGLDVDKQEPDLTESQKETRDEWFKEVSKLMQPVHTTLAENWDVIPNRSRPPPNIQGNMAIVLSSANICMRRDAREAIMSAHDYGSWLASQHTPFGISLNQAVPLFSADHLLTLTHFNTIRGMLSLVLTLGVDPTQMGTDIMSPFVMIGPGPKAVSAARLESLPPVLQPTAVQKTIPHHPELDIMPFPAARDNLIRGMGMYDDHDLCLDVIGLKGTKGSILEELDSEYEQSVASTGLLLWGDPRVPGSWEVTESFARKWAWILTGCEEAFVSTNYWRSRRGERPLRFEELV